MYGTRILRGWPFKRMEGKTQPFSARKLAALALSLPNLAFTAYGNLTQLYTNLSDQCGMPSLPYQGELMSVTIISC